MSDSEQPYDEHDGEVPDPIVEKADDLYDRYLAGEDLELKPFDLDAEEKRRGMDPNKRAFSMRIVNMDTVIARLNSERGVSDPWLVMNHGLDGNEDYEGVFTEDADEFMIDLGRFIAAMGSQLQIKAVFPEGEELLLAEPGPTQLPSSAS